MADPQSPFSLVRWAKGLVGWTPRQAAPESDAAPASTDMVVSQSPEALMLIGPASEAYLKTITANPDTVLRREGSQDLTLFDRLLDDDVCMSNLQIRRLAITSKDWEVEPGDADDPRSVQAADDWRAMLKEVGFDRATGLLHYTLWYGYGVAEYLWTTKVHDGRRIIWLDDILVPDRRWFGFTLDGELRYTAALAAINGEELPPNKFLALRTGGTHDFAFYGLGLAHWAYWPVWFKRAGMKFWALALEKLSQPTAVGGFGPNDSDKEKRTLIDALTAIGRDSAVIVPERIMKDKLVEIMETGRTAAGLSYKDFKDEQNQALMRIILGQPGSSSAQPQGLGSGQATEHAEVKDEIVKADADLISEGVNETAAAWVTRWNHGPDVKPPRVYRVLEVEDLGDIADTDAKLDKIGLRRTEDSVKETYGENFERKPEVEVDPATGLPREPGQPGARPPARPPAAANDDEEAKARRAQFAAGDEVPLYVFRRLKNVASVKRWAADQGIEVDDDLHVTVLYSRTPVDPFRMGMSWNEVLTVPKGGPRKIEKLGDKIVLRFASDDLDWRHESMIERGASHDYESYLIHLSLADAEGVDLDKIEPYVGELVFGPEMFEPIEERPDAAAIIGVTFTAEEEDEIERLTLALMDETNPIIAEFAASIRDNLAAAREASGGQLSLEGARIALLQSFERFPEDRLGRLFGLPLVATRAAAEAGVEGSVEA